MLCSSAADGGHLRASGSFLKALAGHVEHRCRGHPGSGRLWEHVGHMGDHLYRGKFRAGQAEHDGAAKGWRVAP